MKPVITGMVFGLLLMAAPTCLAQGTPWHGIDAIELFVILLNGLLFGIPVLLIFIAIRAFRQIVRRLDRIEKKLRSIEAH